MSAEAGKIALNYIRQDALGDSSHEEAGLETVVGDDGQVSWKSEVMWGFMSSDVGLEK